MFIQILTVHSFNKQWRTWSDVTYVASDLDILFAYLPKRDARLIWIKSNNPLEQNKGTHCIPNYHLGKYMVGHTDDFF